MWLPPVTQSPLYHAFADGRTLYGVPNFWNVFSNVPLLLTALYGCKALASRTAFIDSWERVAYLVLLFATAGVGLGSAYYHWHPDDERLFWDRLPMTIVFTSMVAATIGERVSSQAGKRWLFPVILLGCASVVDWRWSGDLRLYGLVQFGAMLALPVMIVRYPPRYTHDRGAWYMGLFYLFAKVLELFDRQIATVMATGGHPWKHLFAAAAMFCYVDAVVRRSPR